MKKESRYLHIICPKCGCSNMSFESKKTGFSCIVCANTINYNSDEVKRQSELFLKNRFLDIQNFLIEKNEIVTYKIKYVFSTKETILQIHGINNNGYIFISDSRSSIYGCEVWIRGFPVSAKNRNEVLKILKEEFYTFETR